MTQHRLRSALQAAVRQGTEGRALLAPLDAPMLRWTVLCILGILTLLAYRRVLDIASVFARDARLLLWPQLAVTVIYVAMVWIVWSTRPASGRRGRLFELALIVVLGCAF